MERLQHLYEDKATLILNYLMKRGAAYEDAEEIVQNTFVKAIEYEVHFLENSSGWLFKVALNQFYDLCRRTARHPSVMLNDEVLDAELKVVGLEATVVEKERAQVVRTKLAQMGETYQNLLLMKYEMGLSYEEIGKLLGMKPDKVKTYLYRARNRFREEWRNENE